MGKILAFWSPVKGQAKVSASMCAIIAMLGKKYPQTEMAVSSVTEGWALEQGMDARYKLENRKEVYARSGIAALILSCKQGMLTKTSVRRCALSVPFIPAALFPGLGHRENAVHGGNTTELEQYVIKEHLAKEYDLVCLDAGSGFHKQSEECLKQADAVVVVLPQNPWVWEVYSKNCEMLSGKNVGILFGEYLKSSKYGLKQYESKYLGAEETVVGVIPCNAGFRDAVAEGRSAEFLFKNERIGKKEENYEFMESVGKAAEKIKERLFLS